MSAASGDRQSRRSQGAVALFALALAAAGLALIASAGTASLVAPFTLHWAALVPVYVLTLYLPVYFEFRRESHAVTLVQLPLAVGSVLLAPWGHAAARALGSTINSFVLRRHGPLKWLFNLAVGLLEVGLISEAVSLLAHGPDPGLSLWLALLVGLLLAEVVSNLAVTVLMRLLGVRQTAREMLQPVGFAVGTSVVFTAVSILALTAAWAEPLTLPIIATLFLALALAYRGHRRLQSQQVDTERLYEFVAGLRPLSANDTASVSAVLEQVRDLLHASTVDLALTEPTGGWRHVTVSSGEFSAPVTTPPGALSLPGGTPAGAVGGRQHMSTPLYGDQGVLAILSAVDRVGENRAFDMADLRLLETIGAELATALERGRLLADLGVAATTDALTGQPNLIETTRLVDELLARSGGLLLAAVAVDSFREVNDTLGHQVGDELLLEVAARLRRTAPDAIIGRIGGGRFAVAVPADGFSGDAELLGLHLRGQVEGSAQLGRITTHVRLSVGCAQAPEHGTDADKLIRRAETAMYSARHAHGGPVMWEPAYEVQGHRRLAVVMALREALSSGAIGLAFQPKLDLKTGQVTGVEALARWTHPALGGITPDEFIPLAEASGLMGPLTTTVLRQAVTATMGWQRRAPHVGVAINVTAETVLDPGFVGEVADILASAHTAPELLTLELTEGVALDDAELAAVRMGELRALGVKLSVDDFGTGYSSLTYLKGLPVDEVKIDKGFIRHLVDDPADRAVVRAVVDIAHTLGMRVVAEGVEQEDQQQILTTLGVDEVQGYLLARPMAAIDMALWLRRHEVARRDRTGSPWAV